MTTSYSTSETLQEILDSSPVLLMSFRAVRDQASDRIVDFEWITANKKTTDIIGCSHDELIGSRLLTVHPHTGPLGLFDMYTQVVETGETRQTEIAINADGINGWFDISATKLGDGFVLTATETTARKKAELDLVQRTDQLQTTLDASLNSILSMTAIRDGNPMPGYPNGKIVDFLLGTSNEAVIESLGHTPSELAGGRLLAMFPGKIDSGLFDICARVTDTGKPEHVTQYYIDDKGFDGWYDIQAVKQGADGVVLTFMNITETKRHEKQLERSNESLQQFAYIASHDLQEPLRKVKAFSDLLTEQYGDSLGADGMNLVARMQSANSRMQTLIRDLLTYSRLAADDPMPQPVHLDEVMTDVLSDLEINITNNAAELTISPLPTVKGDPLQLRQLFQNLLSNALKFVDPGKKPQIKLNYQLVDGRNVLSGLTGCFHSIQIVDNGIGFDEQYRDRIFTAFQRLNSRKQYEGTGIGLAIVKRVVELHKGVITAQSEPGKGSTFTVYLPAW